MSAVSKNPFDALGDDDDEVEETPKKEVREVKKAAAPAKTSAAPAATHAAKDAAKPQSGSTDANRRPPRREFDRHSGTGRGRRSDGAEDKRGGSGKYNWGTKDAGTTPNDEATEQTEPREMTEEEKAAAEAAAEAKRKEESQITLEDYLKQKQAKDEAEKLEARRAEAIDMKGLKLKNAEGEEVWALGDDDKSGKGGKVKKSGRKATPITEVNFSMPAVETSSGGGGRGRGRGGRSDYRPRAAGGGAAPAAPAVSMDNFPSLS